MRTVLQKTIAEQRKNLVDLLKKPLAELARKLADDMPDRQKLEVRLRATFPNFKYSKYLYVMDARGIQITSTLLRQGFDASSLNRDRSQRPYMQADFKHTDFFLSEAYISKPRIQL